MTPLLRSILLLLWTASFAAAQNAPVLPQSFNGWQKSQSATGVDVAESDPGRAAALREFDLQDFERATYKRDDATMEVRVFRFADATGSYGAFTLYKTPEMATEKIGMQGASNEYDGRVLFYDTNLLVQVKLDKITAMTMADMRELAAALPKAGGQQSKLPIVPTYLPRQNYVKNSAKFAVGPAALGLAGTPIPADLVGFDRSAEVVVGTYETESGRALLTVISYPTNQIAGERLRAMEAARDHILNAQDPNLPRAFSARRSGPLVAVVTGAANESESRSLLASVNYAAEVTWNEPTSVSPRDNVGNLIVNVLYLAGILVALAFVAGLAFGGFRILMKRFFPDRVFDRTQDVEIIRLNIDRH